MKKNSARIKSVLIFKLKIYVGETRDLLDESILMKTNVKTPSDIRILNVTKENIMKSI